jgi:hypothetical protein
MNIMNHGTTSTYNPYQDQEEQSGIKSTDSRDLFNFEREKARLEELSTERRLPKGFKVPGERMRKRAVDRNSRSLQNTPLMSKYSKGTNLTYTSNSFGSG